MAEKSLECNASHLTLTLKTEVKQDEDRLHLETKELMEKLSDDQVRYLLHEKWVKTIKDGILSLDSEMLNQFSKAIEILGLKYAITMNDLEKEIAETEKSLAEMLGDLTGSETDMEGIRELQLLLGGA
ncbi:hypothetical protein [[Clostridium] aminophilum]|uniref:hypothetical protein n=1 Tax=[Clostridium] aminophilum TaxID=1526 RepID=UPI003333BDA2